MAKSFKKNRPSVTQEMWGCLLPQQQQQQQQPSCSESIQVIPALGKWGRYKLLCKSSVYLCFPFNKISLAFLSLFLLLSAGHLRALPLM